MNQPKIFYPKSRKQWRTWLSKNFDKKTEIWLVFPNKSSGETGIEYNTAVEEALCFGWIDSTARSLDKDHRIQRFSVRRKNSTYSQPNKERIKWLLKEDLVHSSLKEHLEKVAGEPFEFPEDILAKIKAVPEAWKNYQSFPESYKRIRIAYIHSARKRPEEFEKRLRNFIEKTRQNKKIIGFGGVEKYY